jgi:hypothetical protein
MRAARDFIFFLAAESFGFTITHAKQIHNNNDKHIRNRQQRSRQTMLIENESCIEPGWWFLKIPNNNQSMIPECFLNILASEYSDNQHQHQQLRPKPEYRLLPPRTTTCLLAPSRFFRGSWEVARRP